jgi:excisionase family DNA binding protein
MPRTTMKKKIIPSSNEEGLLFDNQVLTIEQTALFLNLSVGTIYNKVSRREIPYRKPKSGGRLYFFKSELINWIDDGLR